MDVHTSLCMSGISRTLTGLTACFRFGHVMTIPLGMSFTSWVFSEQRVSNQEKQTSVAILVCCVGKILLLEETESENEK